MRTHGAPGSGRGWRPTLMALAGAATLLLLGAQPALAGEPSCGQTPVITGQPTTTQVDTAMTPPVVVQVENSNGQTDWGFQGTVTLTYAVNPVGAAEPSGNVVNAVHGVATFSQLTFPSVGFGFELVASIQGATSQPSQPFDIVGQLVHCQPGQACQSGTVSSAGTSGSARSPAASGSGVLTATGGGFPRLSCTTRGGVLTFTSSRSTVITISTAAHGWHSPWSFNACWGAPEPFVTKGGHLSAFNPANGDYEGLLPFCSWGQPGPCVQSRYLTWFGTVVITVRAPAGDPHITF
jgi:hypothetical protein